MPATGNDNNETFVVEGYVPPKGADMNLATVSQVIGDYFQAMGDSRCCADVNSRCGQVRASNWC